MADLIRQNSESQAGWIQSAAATVPMHLNQPYVAESSFGSPDRVEQNIYDANINAVANRSQIILPASIRNLGTMYLNIGLAAPTSGAYNAYAGLNVMQSYRIIHGSNTLVEVNNPRATIKAALKYLGPGFADGVMDALGGSAPANGALNVCIPIVAPWGRWGSYRNDQTKFLPLHKSSNAVPLRIEIVWNPNTTLSAHPPAGNSITSAYLVMEAQSWDPELLRSDTGRVAIFGRDYMSLQPFTPGSGGVPATPYANVSQSLLGFGTANVEALYIFSTTNAGGFAGAGCGDFATSDLTHSSVTIDGKSYNQVSAPTRAQIAMDNVMLGLGSADSGNTAGSGRVPVIPFSVNQTADATYSGGLPTQTLRDWRVTISTTTATDIEYAVAVSAVITIEDGLFTRKRI